MPAAPAAVPEPPPTQPSVTPEPFVLPLRLRIQNVLRSPGRLEVFSVIEDARLRNVCSYHPIMDPHATPAEIMDALHDHVRSLARRMVDGKTAVLDDAAPASEDFAALAGKEIIGSVGR